MNDKPGETPKSTPAPDREKIRQILEIARKVVCEKQKPKEIIKRIAWVIDKPAMNFLARILSLLIAEYAPETLLENGHVIRGQEWENAVLQIVMAKIKEGEESE